MTWALQHLIPVLNWLCVKQIIIFRAFIRKVIVEKENIIIKVTIKYQEISISHNHTIQILGYVNSSDVSALQYEKKIPDIPILWYSFPDIKISQSRN